SRHGSSGRRRRNRFGCGRALSARLRICAGLLLRRADERGRRQGATAGRGRERRERCGAPQTDRPIVVPLTQATGGLWLVGSGRWRRGGGGGGVRRGGVAWQCVPRLAGEHAEIDADLLQRLLVFTAGVLTENQLGIGRAMQPAVMLDLVLELARRPPGIAER